MCVFDCYPICTQTARTKVGCRDGGRMNHGTVCGWVIRPLPIRWAWQENKNGCLFVTYRCPNCWTKWAKISYGGGNGPDRFVGWCDPTPPSPPPPPLMGVAGKMNKNYCLFVTYRRPNRWNRAKIWHGGGDGPWDCLCVGWVCDQALPLQWAWQGNAQECLFQVGGPIRS